MPGARAARCSRPARRTLLHLATWAVLWLAVWPAPLAAQEEDAASRTAEVAAPDTALDASPALSDTAAAASKPDGGFFASPTAVMLRSLVVPGWGQATNGEWWKAGVAVAAEGYLIYALVRDTHRLEELDPSSIDYALLEDQRNANAWWLGGVVLISMLDAYVGAHLKGIKTKIGPEPETQEMRVGLQWEFR